MTTVLPGTRTRPFFGRPSSCLTGSLAPTREWVAFIWGKRLRLSHLSPSENRAVAHLTTQYLALARETQDIRHRTKRRRSVGVRDERRSGDTLTLGSVHSMTASV